MRYCVPFYKATIKKYIIELDTQLLFPSPIMPRDGIVGGTPITRNSKPTNKLSNVSNSTLCMPYEMEFHSG